MAVPEGFGGVICPIVTPFDDSDRVDEQAVAALVEFLIAKGIHGLMIGGSTGEGALMSLDERRHLTELVVRQVNGRCLTLAHVGCMSTADTVALTRHAAECGADAGSAIVPFFYTYDQQSLRVHYETALAAVPGYPMFIYSFPGNAKNDISVELVQHLSAGAPNLAGLKVSSSDLVRIQEYIALDDGALMVFTGSDGLMLPGLAVGSRGGVSGNANVFPELFCALYDAFHRGALQQAREIQARINKVRHILQDGMHPAFFKAALELRGLTGGRVRAPMREISSDERHGMEQALMALGLL
ncbi:MAG: dihydrodipicolinate synthase family protein [Anaerolineae bacterium]|jgi:4-hydroxy-tetrahydrodipicolinate synthase